MYVYIRNMRNTKNTKKINIDALHPGAYNFFSFFLCMLFAWIPTKDEDFYIF